MTTIAMIPGRIGSTRLKMKNLALLGGRPLMSYAIEAAKASGMFDRIIVNADHESFEAIASQYGAECYLRPAALGSSETRSDEVVYDFMKRHPADAVAWVNPTSPLQTGEEIRAVVEHFHAKRLDSLITVEERSVHGLVNGRPVNFSPEEPFARTQDLTPVELFVYSVMMWRTATFRRAFEEKGYALLSGAFGVYPVSKAAAVLIKTPEDLQLAEALLQAGRKPGMTGIRYDERAPAASPAALRHSLGLRPRSQPAEEAR